VDAGNAYLPTFPADYNRRFAGGAAQSDGRAPGGPLSGARRHGAYPRPGDYPHVPRTRLSATPNRWLGQSRRVR